MEITESLYVTNRADWRAWLEKHYQTKNEIWLVYAKKESGKPRIGYNQAVEVALCFGWIDSIVKKIDKERFAQRFTPRNPKSAYSQTNKERLRRLIAQNKITKDVAAILGDMLAEEFVFPEDIMKTLQKNRQAWDNFQAYSGSYQRIRVAFIDTVRKRPEVFQKRLRYFLKMTEQGKQYGHDIQDYY